MDGVINVYKEKGYTSHDVTAIIKRLSGERAGHAGTLDPDAEGVLIILIGKATKLSDYLMDGGKEYRASVKFGAVTSTYDSTGEILQEENVNFTEDELIKAVASFKGEQFQIPPMYSAIKKDGKKLCDLARKGITIERNARKVFIDDIFVESFNGYDEAEIYVKCGKGTYIRSICHDLGQNLGCGAYMSKLIRTRSGSFSSDNGITINEIRSVCDREGEKGLERLLITIDEALSVFNRLTACSGAEKQLYNGAKIEPRLLKSTEKIDALNVLYDNYGNLIGIYEAVTNDGDMFLKPKTMLFKSD